MESSNLNSINDVETDRASFLPIEEKTCDRERRIAGTKQEYFVAYPPEFVNDQLATPNCGSGGVDLYQCSSNKHDYGSGSDSAEEEQSPYSSTEKLKFEALVPTGTRQEKTEIRKKPSIPSHSSYVPENRYMKQSLQKIKEPYKPGPRAEECDYNETTDALVLTGSVTEKVPARQSSRPHVRPQGEIASSTNEESQTEIMAVTQCQSNSMFENIDARLATFFNNPVDWPHTKPSPEQMARAGLIYKGVYTFGGKKIYDMVECYKCGKTLYGFTENDDPVAEHRKYYPNCH